MYELARIDHDRQSLFTPEELSQRWGKSLSTLANMRSAGTGPQYIKLGKTIRYRRGDVVAYEQQHVRKGDAR